VVKRLAEGISHLGQGLQVQHNDFASFVQLSAERLDAFNSTSERFSRIQNPASLDA